MNEQYSTTAQTALFTIEIYYCSQVIVDYDRNNNPLLIPAPELKMFRMENVTGSKIMQIRENVYTAGIERKIEPGYSELISPHWIKKICIYKQARFFYENDKGKKLTRG